MLPFYGLFVLFILSYCDFEVIILQGVLVAQEADDRKLPGGLSRDVSTMGQT